MDRPFMITIGTDPDYDDEYDLEIKFDTLGLIGTTECLETTIRVLNDVKERIDSIIDFIEEKSHSDETVNKYNEMNPFYHDLVTIYSEGVYEDEKDITKTQFVTFGIK